MEPFVQLLRAYKDRSVNFSINAKINHMGKLIAFMWLCSLSLMSFAQQQNNSVEKQWFNNGPYAVHVNCLDVSKSDPNTIYLGSYGRGVFVTTDKGLSWKQCSTLDWPVFTDSVHVSPTQPNWWFGPYPPVTFITVDPTDSKHVYIGLFMQGIRESNDGGETWKAIATEIPSQTSFTKLLINKKNTDELFAAGGGSINGGLYRSNNKGQTWQVVDSVPHGDQVNINDIVRDPIDNNHLFIGIGPNGSTAVFWGLMESLDNGITWSVVNNISAFKKICINPENPDHLLSILYNSWGDWVLGKSTDGGLNFEYQYPSIFYYWSTSLYGDDRGNLFVTMGTERQCLFFSPDFGATWQPIDTVNYWYPLNAAQQVRSAPGGFYYGNLYGFFYANAPTEALEIRNGTINNSYMLRLAVDPRNDQVLYAAGEQGFWKSTDGANSWAQLAHWTVNAFAIDPRHPDTIYYGGYRFRRSFDGGRTYEESILDPYGLVHGIAINPVHTNILYCKTSLLFLKSEDYGANWEILFHTTGTNPPVLDPNHPDTLYMGTGRSLDGGKHWTDDVDKIVVKVQRGNSKKLYTLAGGELSVSDDWGLTWKTLDNYESYPRAAAYSNNFYLDENNDQNMYFTTGHGIRYSTNEGQTWNWFKGGFNSRALDIIAMPDKDIYYVATYGFGVWAYNNYTSINDSKMKALEPENKLVASPNPFSGSIKIANLSQAKGNLKIFNLMGQIVCTMDITQNEPFIVWDGKDDTGNICPVGTYLVIYSGEDGEMKSGKILKL